MNEKDVGQLFTTNGEDVWRMMWYQEYPSACLRNLETGKEANGAIGSRILKPFRRLIIQGSYEDKQCQ